MERCTPIANSGLDTILSAFQVRGENDFAALARGNRHHLFASVLQHTGGMRYGQFGERDYTLDSFICDAKDGSHRLVTDYSRYAGRLEILYRVRDFSTFRVHVVPCAELRWHIIIDVFRC